MSVVREKAEGFTKQIIGEMIGDKLLVEEGKAQQQHAEHASEAPPPSKPSHATPAERRDH